MPELPEMEAWRRQLDQPVRAFPITKAGPAHVATLKTFDPPLSTLEGRRLAGARRRAKRLLFPTEDGDLVLLVHLMTAGRLRYLRAGEKGPKAPAFRLEFQNGSQLVLTEAGSKKRAGVWLLTPEAADAGRAWANEILHHANLSPFALSRDLVPGQVQGLAAAIDLELERGLELRERGANDARTYRVHGKLREPCYVCGTPIARVDYEEHTVYYCPDCQTGGRVLKDRRLSRLLR